MGVVASWHRPKLRSTGQRGQDLTASRSRSSGAERGLAQSWPDVQDGGRVKGEGRSAVENTPETPAVSRTRLMRIIVAITGASGALYAQRLLDNLDARQHEIHVVISSYGQAVLAEELPGGLRLSPGVTGHGVKAMNVPFVSGSNPFDAMVVIPCTMGTMGRIAHGFSEDVLLRAADVMLKERRKLILVPRETPLNLVHVKNMELLLQAGAILLPANPSFYTKPKTVQEVVDTVVARVLDHLGIAHALVGRWGEEARMEDGG
jgi:flavin prenyltransferase